jgi:prepilin-type N-terminal cleavage/methylation domain-containing protein
MPGKIGRTGSLQAADGKWMEKKSPLSSAKGVTLIEVMIALVVLLIVFMGLIQAALLSIDHNLRNEVRDEAVRIAADTMTRLKSMNFDNVDLAATASAPAFSVNPYPTSDPKYDSNYLTHLNTPLRQFRKFSQQYTVTKVVKNIDADNKQVTVNVTYTYRTDNPVTYTINSVLVNPAALN